MKFLKGQSNERSQFHQNKVPTRNEFEFINDKFLNPQKQKPNQTRLKTNDFFFQGFLPILNFRYKINKSINENKIVAGSF